jgi:DNA-binding NtrC family response regulator
MMRIIPVRTLVIDDEEAVCRRIAAWLREATCDVVTFTQAATGLQHAARAPCALGLVDLHLTGADGIEVITALRTAAPAMRIIAMSAFPDTRRVIAAMRAGARDLLEKPIQREQLLEALARQLTEVGAAVRSEPEFNQRLGARLRAVRLQAGRTLADVAAECGLTVAQLSAVELGKSGTSTWGLARIGYALKMPLDRLLASL